MNLDAVIRADWQFRSEQAARTFPIGAYERMSRDPSGTARSQRAWPLCQERDRQYIIDGPLPSF
jgi:hypothetical protein